ncbi:MAG: thioredoxin-disulfide reductase [Dehalococcoidia bacterium]|jgi:thioredoxin reductase (NADPH)|nr:thioredoxin-disulfide reductase [Dehalococcoidia bacterium]
MNYQVIVLGGGPAGLSAAIYAARSGYTTVLIEKAFPGGQIANASLVENYPAYPDGVSGMELGQLMHRQAEIQGAETMMAEVMDLVPGEQGAPHVVKTSDGEVHGVAIIIATGSRYRLLDVPGEAELTGKGVSYCATCDGPFYRGKRVAVVGGGDTAITDALELTHFAEQVTVIHRRAELRASAALQQRALSSPRIRFEWNSVVEAVEGEPVLQALRLRNTADGAASVLPVDGVFVAVGSVPSTGFLRNTVPLDDSGCVVTNELMETSIAGVYAAGDVRHNSARQVITAAGDGATAALSARRYISSL